MLRFRLKERLAEKNRTDDTALTWIDVARATGISRQCLSTMANTGRRIVTNTAHIETLARYFRCQVGDLIELAETLDELPEHRLDVLYPGRRAERPDD